MRHIVNTSGGLGSFITLDLVCRDYGSENVTALFADTMIEDDDLYRFLAEGVTYTGATLTKIQDGRTPWQVFRDEKFIGNTRVDPCSKILKRQLLDRWIQEHHTPDCCTIYVGIDASESHRLHRLAERRLPFIYKAPMVELGMMPTTQEKMAYCRERGIEPPRLYGLGFHHNNCGGFCVKAGLAQFKLLYEKLPARYEEHVQEELLTRACVPNARPFLRKTVDGQLTYLWLDEYRELLKKQALTQEEEMEWGGCGCALE